MTELIISIIVIVLLVSIFKLVFKAAFGAVKVIAAILLVLTAFAVIPAVIACL